MKAVILAAGRGTRMMPLTENTPKPLLRLRDKTLLDHIFDVLPSEVDEVIIVVKYLADKIKQHCGNFYKERKIYYAEGSDNGSAYSLLAVRSFIKEQERFLIIYGDELPSRDEIERCLNNSYAWLCYEVADPRLSGIATIADDGRILEVIEKPTNPKSHWAATGVMLANSDIFKYEPARNKNGEYYLSSLMSQFARDHRVTAVKTVIDVSARPHFTSPADIDPIQ